MKTASALSYFGSDSEVAKQLAGLLNGCQHVTIPFVGGGSIIPHLSARAILANDLNEAAINFYRVVSGVLGDDKRHQLIGRCRHTLSHPDEIELASQILDGRPGGAKVDHAWAYWALCWIGRKGKGGTSSMGGKPSVRWTPEGGTNATRIRAAAADLSEWAETLERCEWTCMDFRDVLAKVKDDSRCGLYIDPPWVGAGDAYMHKFDESQHRALHADLSRFRAARVVVRYGDHPMIRELYSGWEIIDAASRTQSNSVKGEIWITSNSNVHA